MLRTTAFRKWTSNLYSHQKCGLSEKGWKGMLAKNDKVVANSGSIARDILLAAERTFLAWSRTGLGFVGAGSAMFAAYHRYATSKNDEERFYQQEHIYPASALLVSNGAFQSGYMSPYFLTRNTVAPTLFDEHVLIREMKREREREQERERERERESLFL